MSAEGVPYAYIGGFAVAFQGVPRATQDIDAVILINDDRLDDFFPSGAGFGFRGRDEDALAFARRYRVLRLQHLVSNIPVDVSLAGISIEIEAIQAAEHLSAGDLSVPFAPPENLVAMKAVARRPRDAADIEGLLDRHPDLDLERVRTALGEIGEILDDSSLLMDFDALVQRWRASHL
jgi:hypothetical protein